MEIAGLFLMIALVSMGVHGCQNSDKYEIKFKKCLEGKVITFENKEFTCHKTERQLKLDELEKQRKELLNEEK